MGVRTILLGTIKLLSLIALIGGIAIYINPDLLFSIIPNVFGNSGFIFDIWNESKDKLGHFIFMGLCAFLINFLLNGRAIKRSNGTVLLGNILLIIFTTLEEVRHLFLEGRNFEILDLLSGFAGILIFGNLAAFLIKKI